MYGKEEFADGKGRPRGGNPRFYQLLEEMAETHDIKSHDYASDNNPSGNYHFAGTLAGLFSHSPEDAGFVGRIGEKIYRLSNLEGGGKHPKNESIEDTERDIAVIVLLWMTDRRERRNKPNALETELFDLIKLMPDSQTQSIIDFIYDMRRIRAGHGINPEMSQQSRDVMRAEAGKAPDLYTPIGAYAKETETTGVPNQGQTVVSPQVAEILRMILATNRNIQKLLTGA